MIVAFEPDARLQARLTAEHQSGVHVVRELMAIANMFRNQRGTYEDYILRVKVSYFWASFQGSTSTPEHKHEGFLETAWGKTEECQALDLESSLVNLSERISSARWQGRTGSRNRQVALAFVAFCYEHNCFTRTISTHELAKWTNGLSQPSVSRALGDLVRLRLLARVDRTDRRETKRSARQYELKLNWRPTGAMVSGVTESMNTGKDLLIHERHSTSDVWSHRGLGESARRVYTILTDEHSTVREIADRAGMSRDAARHALVKLTNNCLAGTIPGRPVKYFRVDTPLDVVADSLGVAGYVEHQRQKIELRQYANRMGYPKSYSASQAVDLWGNPEQVRAVESAPPIQRKAERLDCCDNVPFCSCPQTDQTYKSQLTEAR